MPDAIKSSRLKLYADDSLLYRRIKSDSDKELLQEDLNNIHSWAVNSQMKFNVSKCEHLRISRKSKLPISVPTYNLNNIGLRTVDQAKHLGVVIDNHLSFKTHIVETCKKANRSLYMLMRSLKKAKTRTRTVAYKTICRPILEYACHIWSPYQKKYIAQLENVNRKAFRWAYRLRKRDHITQLMIDKNWCTLLERRCQIDTNLHNRILTGKATVDTESFNTTVNSKYIAPEEV